MSRCDMRSSIGAKTFYMPHICAFCKAAPIFSRLICDALRLQVALNLNGAVFTARLREGHVKVVRLIQLCLQKMRDRSLFAYY